jgi:putative oxidoreductase
MLTATIEVTSGLALVLGFLTREFALLLVVFNVSAAAIGHPYWSIHGDANARWAQFIGFWKDIGLAGGALFLLARGAGRLSLDQIVASQIARMIIACRRLATAHQPERSPSTVA